ncbi:MAG: hypothetical protein AUI04_13370 [Candidatus Rokubacteria bacterium 13_2_20CM_2_64_8]|nr:MAG: hypothetical protein AUI04_13370 [Candidatus Rokubacteria bacterium 13_2_20CM_2_64_8]
MFSGPVTDAGPEVFLAPRALERRPHGPRLSRVGRVAGRALREVDLAAALGFGIERGAATPHDGRRHEKQRKEARGAGHAAAESTDAGGTCQTTAAGQGPTAVSYQA